LALDIDKKKLENCSAKPTAAPFPRWKGWKGREWEEGRDFIIAGKSEMFKFCMRKKIIVLEIFK
jgi:hypothetical protein